MVENLRSNVTLGGMSERRNTERVSRFRRIENQQENQRRTSRFRPIPSQETSEVTSNQTLNMSQMPITFEFLENADRISYVRRTQTSDTHVEEIYSVEYFLEEGE